MEHEHVEQQQLPGMEDGPEGYNIPVPEKPEAVKATTAFLIVCFPDGRKTAMSDVNTELDLEREATLNDMFDGAGQVIRDVNLMLAGSSISSNTINGMLQAMAQQAEFARQSKIEQKLMQKGIHLPGR